MAIQFPSREAAGSLLAEALSPYRSDRPVLLALPRGGVEVGRAVAQAFGLSLYPLIVRKLASFAQPEVAFGAIAEGGGMVVEPAFLPVSPAEMEEILERERAELARRQALYSTAPRPSLRGRTVILVDDGMATGFTMIAAVRAVGRENPGHVIVAVPVASPGACQLILREGATCVCLIQPPDLRSVGSWYEEFPQLTDEKVIKLLQPIPS